MDWSIKQPSGNALAGFRQNLSKRLTIAAAKATQKAARLAKEDLRRDMRAQRLGGLANVIASTSDRQKGRVTPGDISLLDVAGFVSVKGVKSPRTAGALKSYIDQETTSITPVRGRWLAMPTKEIPSKAGKFKMTPERYRAAGLEEKLGKLQFVKSKRPGIAYLVINDVTIRTDGKKGKTLRLPKRGTASKGRGHVSIVAFVLIRATRRSMRVSPAAVAEKWARRLPALLNQELR
jgi:hypothetical protein